ncbi:protein TALPID3 isoform X3 [Amphiprion ocellaris]|uniref:protein TALPID3 isoform X3 n=1 Tax=Amphiprion ocellaris TaxID=80972 RepID=UPI00241158B6|nr:protein TALPID3 isoform X3 [Amphiprion ocellaris]
MLSRPGSGSLSGPVSPDQSSCSSETGSVLIRSTRALPRRHGAGAGNVQITVQKLREPPRVQAPLTGQRLRQKPEISDAKPAAADREPGPDLLTSRFEAGGRGVVLAALKQRSHSAPHRREVRVQMLDQLPLQTSADPQDAALSSQNATGVASVQREAELNSGRHGDASSAATTAAAVVAAAAPLIKAQSDMEARVSQLADRVEKLLQPERHGEGRGRSLSQQTLQQLETLQNQQLQLQSQLLESALRIVTGHAPTTSDLTAPGRPAHLQVTHLDAAANGRSSSATAASSAAVETVPVAMETCRRDRWPEQTRDEWYLRGASRVSAAERTHLHFSSNDSQEVVRRANEMLREMGRLKTEMKVLLTPEDSLETSRPVPDHLQVQQNQHLTRLHQSHQNQTQQNQSKQNKPPKTQSQQNRSQQKQSQQVPSQSHQNQSQQIQFQQDQSQYKKSNQSQSQLSQYHQNQSNQNKSQQNQSQQKQSQQIPSQSHQNQSQQKKSQQNQFHYEKSQQNQSQPQLSQCHQNQSNQNQSQQNQSQQIQSQQHQSESHQDQSQQNNSQHNQSHSQLSQCLQNSSHQHQSQSKQTSSQDNHFTYKPSHFQQNQSQFLQSQSQQNQSQNYQEHHFRSEPSQFHQNQSHQHTSQQNQSHPLFHQIQPKQHQTHRAQSEQFQSVLVQRKPVVPSPLEEAGQVLRQVRRQKKVLEENLEALLRAKTGEVLHCQLEALAANRDWTEEVRIKKTVDACISTLTRDIQAEMSLEDAARCRATDAAVTSQSSAHPGKRKPLSMPRTAGSRPMAGRGSRGRTAGHKAGAEPDAASGRLMDSQQVGGESYLNRLYGRAPYEGQRRTLKKSPYLRLNSPASPLGRKPRPRLVESVRGVKLKSCKTQTSLAPPLNVAPPLSLSPGRRQHRHVFSSSHLTSGDPAVLSVTPAESFPVAVAIPLGRPRIDSSRRPRTVTSSPPAPPPEAAVVAIDDGSPEQQKQQLDEDEAPPPSNTVDIIERKSEEEEEEEEKEEENVFPGSDFLSVADVIQQEVSVEAEEEVLLDGGPSPPPVLYQGPAFPPQASSGLPAQDQVSVPGIEQQRDALETRLVEWVEQQLMSRIISDMYRPPQPDPAHNQHTDQSELEEGSVTSEIVEAAGGGGLQLFVDSNTSVDSDLIRQLVNEVLTETVGLMLGQRETGPGPGTAEQQQVKLAPLVLTPVPTPPPSPTQPSRETGPVTTPPPSEPTSPLNRESPQPITVPEPVATPPPSPEPGSPAAVQAPPPLTWGDAELPLDEERPEEHLDSPKQQLLMSVAEEEPPLSSPLPPPSLSTARSPSPPPEPEPASPSGGSESSSSSSISSSSTSTVTAGTEAALRHISEGEMLISLNQLAAMTEEEAVDSFSSSLQELQEMDLDPPSEGQIRGQDLLLINRMEERVTSRGERPQPGDSWGKEEEVSVGEVRDERPTKPHRTTNPSWQSQTSSPGQISQAADIGFEATNQSSVAVGNRLEPMETLTSDLSLTPPPHLEETNAAAQVVVKQLDSPTGKQEVDDRGRSRKLEVQLESFRPDESISGASDSSSDVF